MPPGDWGGAGEATDAAIGLPLGVRTTDESRVGSSAGQYNSQRNDQPVVRLGRGASSSRRNARPSRASVSESGASGRQIAAARAIASTRSEKVSMTTRPV